MTDSQFTNDTNREDLLQRIALMETMIAEGRRSTTRFGWIFVLWGLVDIFGMGWEILRPNSYLVWPVTIGSGLIVQFLTMAWRRRTGKWCTTSQKSRAISAIWGMMGVTTALYCFTGIFSHQAGSVQYVAAIFMFVGLAHAISAIILRWRVQGFVAAIWWAGGVACFFVPTGQDLLVIFILEMLFGMVFFGLYAMWLERQRPSAPVVQQHA